MTNIKNNNYKKNETIHTTTTKKYTYQQKHKNKSTLKTNKHIHKKQIKSTKKNYKNIGTPQTTNNKKTQ